MRGGLRVGIAGSLVGHGVIIGVIIPAFAVTPPPPRVTRVRIALMLMADPAPRRGPPLPVVLGAADFVSDDPRSPFPLADLDLPALDRAAPGGGAAGGSTTWTGRSDPAPLRAQPWNDPHDYRLPRVRTAEDRATRESQVRLADPGLDARLGEAARRARTGGAPLPLGAGGAAGTPRRGDVETRRTRPLAAADPVESTNAAPRHGRTRDDVAANQASSERRPMPLDLTTPRAGGAPEDEGVAGPAQGGPSAVARSGAGSGAATADVAAGRGQPSTRARPQDPYLRLLYARVLHSVHYPDDLRLSLDQGEVVVAFAVDLDDGSVSEVRVARSSGFAAFDDAAVAAIRRAAPFGPVPRSLHAGPGAMRVSTPVIFANPLIR